jgi:hypothetical protein
MRVDSEVKALHGGAGADGRVPGISGRPRINHRQAAGPEGQQPAALPSDTSTGNIAYSLQYTDKV